jgi:Mg2+-importing ATPase
MTDFPEMNIASDNVDPEMVMQPRRWDIKFIRKFMLIFGILSSVFDYLTFGALLYILHASETQFRTGWFMESVISASLVVLVIRSRRTILQSRPGKSLLIATLSVVVATLILPFTPLDQVFGFSKLPISFIGVIIGIVIVYIVFAEIAKKVFYKFVRLT